MFGNRPTRTVAAQNLDTMSSDDGTSLNIVEIPAQPQAIIQRNSGNSVDTSMEQELKCDLQLINNSFDLDASEWTHMAKDCTGETTTGTLESKERGNFLTGVFDERADSHAGWSVRVRTQ